MLIDEKGEYTAIREMRKHVAWYVKGMKNATIIRNEINTYETYDECVEIFKENFYVIIKYKIILKYVAFC